MPDLSRQPDGGQRPRTSYRYYAAEHDLIEGQQAGLGLRVRRAERALSRSRSTSRSGSTSVSGPAVIISSSGMMTGGRILHHLKQRLRDPRNTIVLGGFMAEGTRGRMLQDGAQYLRLFGADVPVRAAVVQVSALSGHAGHDELLRWLTPLPPPKRSFITHGELASAQHFAEDLRRLRNWDVVVPKMGQSFELE